MTTFDIKFKNNTANTTNNGNIYSKMLDDIILDSMMKNNSYLFTDTKKEKEADLIDAMFADINNTYIGKSLKDDDLFIKACKILANCGKKKAEGITFGKIYRLYDGTPIIFYNDEIQIGTDLYSYSDFNNFDFISSLTPEKKKIIIDINIKL